MCLRCCVQVSARDACRRLNSSIECEAYVSRFDESNALELCKQVNPAPLRMLQTAHALRADSLQYDLIVDATDNVATRYLINDAAIICKKVVVSGRYRSDTCLAVSDPAVPSLLSARCAWRVRLPCMDTTAGLAIAACESESLLCSHLCSRADCWLWSCRYPEPPPPNTVTNCSDGGVTTLLPLSLCHRSHSRSDSLVRRCWE